MLKILYPFFIDFLVVLFSLNNQPKDKYNLQLVVANTTLNFKKLTFQNLSKYLQI